MNDNNNLKRTNMYYEEKEIDGILCFRLSPKGIFTKYSQCDLTNKLNLLKQKLSKLSEDFEDLKCDYNDLLDRQ